MNVTLVFDVHQVARKKMKSRSNEEYEGTLRAVSDFLCSSRLALLRGAGLFLQNSNRERSAGQAEVLLKPWRSN